MPLTSTHNTKSTHVTQEVYQSDYQSKKDAARGNVLVQFEKKTDKHTVFKARAKLAGTPIGMDDDLTRLQQERKNAAWADFRAFRSQGIRTQWRAEKLFVLEGEHFVEHKVPCL